MVRFKNRWLLVDVTLQPGADAASSSTSTLLKAIRTSLQDNFGDAAAGALAGSIAIKYFSPSTRTAILRCSRVGVREVWGAVTLCNEWEGKQVRMVTLHCGGTIRKVQEAAIRINRRRIEALYRERKRLAQQSRPALLQDGTGEASEWDTEAARVLEEDKKTIHAIQQ